MMHRIDAQNLVEKFTAREHSFYRTLYKIADDAPARVISSENEWSSIPFVTKSDLTACTIEERMFCAREDVDHIRSTSGTTGTPPLFCARTPLRHMEYREEYHDFKNPILAYGVPAMPHWHEAQQRMGGHFPRVIVFDPKNVRASVRLARAAGVDALSLFAFHIPLVGEAMREHGIAHYIRFIEICGESCTHALFEYMRTTFPNATIIPFYGSSEVEDSPIGMPCRAITGNDPLAVYHAKSSQYHEIIDPETGIIIEPTAGAEGELVLTAYPGEPCALPLIRFRTGDMIRVVEPSCSRHGTWSFTVLGRVSMDFVKVLGGVLRTDEIERVLRSLSPLVSDRFQAHRTEVLDAGTPKMQLILHIECPPHVDREKLADTIARSLRVNPMRTYAQGVADGMYLPLTCVPLAAQALSGKSKKLFTQ